MKRNILSFMNKVIRLMIVISFVFLVANGSKKIESKVVNENLNRTLDLTSMAERVQEELDNNLYASIDTYTGALTGYVANCPLCGGRLACKPDYAVLNNGVNTYEDILYGEINIVASSKNLPCGSIVKFDATRVSENPIIAIVLDRGVRGNALDLLMTSDADARSLVGRMSITYEVLRNGWER